MKSQVIQRPSELAAAQQAILATLEEMDRDITKALRILTESQARRAPVGFLVTRAWRR
jgi:hypothetical protein